MLDNLYIDLKSIFTWK